MNDVVLIFALLRSFAEDAASQPPSQIVWLPVGEHQISAGTAKGGSWTGIVKATEAGARAAQASLLRTMAAGRPAWIDFNHEDGMAAGWVKSFEWDPGRGIIANVEWTPRGVDALKGKEFRSFSPTFTLNRETSEVSGLWEGHAAGGLVNAPAFGAAMPALAARLAGAETANTASGGTPDSNQRKIMKKEQLIALLASLGIQHAPDATEDQLVALLTSYKPANAEQTAIVASLKNDIEALKARELALRKRAAKTAVDAAVARGAIKKEDTALQARWTALLETDEQNAELLAALPGTEKPAAVIVEVGVPAAASATATPNVIETLKAMHAERDPLKRGQIYRGTRDFVTKSSAEVIPLLAANSLGSLAGDLIVLRALDLVKLSFPVLGSITTDFSAENARQGQAIKTRIISVPTVVTLNDTTGWASSDVTTTDVSVTIGQPKGVQIEYGSTELASTGRDLFAEQVEACHYALGKDLVDALYAVITAANFTNATTKATASVARADFVAMEKALASRGIEGVRTLLANVDIYERLSVDSTLVNLATYQKPEMVTGTALPPVAGFNVIRAVNLPATGNLTAFGFRKDALVVATRLPEDYVKNAPAGAAHGVQSVVINPDTGIAVQKTDFVDHKLAKAYSRIAWAYGVAKGNGVSGQRLISA